MIIVRSRTYAFLNAYSAAIIPNVIPAQIEALLKIENPFSLDKKLLTIIKC